MIRDLTALENPHRGREMEWFYRTEPGGCGERDRFLGLTVPQSRSVAANHLKASRADLDELFRSEFHEIRFCALVILTKEFEKTKDAGQKAELFEYYLSLYELGAVNSWDLVDVSASRIGKHLMGQLGPIELLVQRTRSKNLWVQRGWVEQRRLARFVHSELQSRLRAFALRMDLAERMPTAAEISELRMQCQSALLVGSEQREFLLFQNDIQELWGGLIDIRFHANSTSMAALQDDPYATAAAIEICREGIGNAAKHSKAKVIDINIQSSGGRSGQLDIEIVNDGSSTLGGEQGFGLRTIAELASNWTLSKRGSETVLHAKIPIQLAAQRS